MNPELPKRTKNHNGNLRRIGVELEFSGLDLEDIAAAVQSEFGGNIIKLNDYEIDVSDTEFGTFRIELDAMFLKDLGRRKKDDATLFSQLEKFGEDMLAGATKPLVPREVCSPPMPIDQLYTLNPLLVRLRKLGAKGTHESLIYAFGVHLNPELPDLKTTTIVAYMQSFALLYDWLKKQQRIDVKRRLSSFIQEWSKDYVLKICQPDYTPDQAKMIDDYLQENPSRNRALDMLPLLTHLDEQRVRKRLPEEKIKPRPTFHYRMPNCEIDRADWGVDDAWEYWLYVEALANDDARRAEMCSAYIKHHQDVISSMAGDWAKDTTQWL